MIGGFRGCLYENAAPQVLQAAFTLSVDSGQVLGLAVKHSGSCANEMQGANPQNGHYGTENQ